MKFTEFNISPALLKALESLNIQESTHIQEKAYPVVLSGADMVGIAQTGTGKTFAYLLPIMKQWKFSKEKNPSVLVVVPTRELVVQVVESVQKLSEFMTVRVAGVYGGINMVQQSPDIIAGLDILVGTPGRLLDFALNGVLKLKDIKKFVIDEVDEMLNLGFRPQLVRLMDLLPSKRQNLMFSATMSDEVNDFIHDNFVDPKTVEAAGSGTPLENIKQAGILVPNFKTKINLLAYFIENHKEFSKVLLFTSSKAMADEVYNAMETDFADQIGIIHSNKSQNFRFESLRRFNEGSCRVLIATDIVARGLDFDDITHVVNFDLPEVAENYIHRIGRTGRVDKKGVAISFITPDDQAFRLELEALMNKKISQMSLPPDVLVETEIMPFELPEVKMKNQLVKLQKMDEGGGAFHEKIGKNKKVNQKVRRAEAMRLKYGKPKTRGQKK